MEWDLERAVEWDRAVAAAAAEPEAGQAAPTCGLGGKAAGRDGVASMFPRSCGFDT